MKPNTQQEQSIEESELLKEQISLASRLTRNDLVQQSTLATASEKIQSGIRAYFEKLMRGDCWHNQ